VNCSAFLLHIGRKLPKEYQVKENGKCLKIKRNGVVLDIVHNRPVAMLPIGYPAEAPKEKTTRGPRDLVHSIA
jgi:nitroreductase